MGIAYILKLLDQEADFDSLHFFDSARNLYQSQIDKVKHEMAGMHKRRQADELQARAATLARLDKMLREFALVQFAFQGAKTFFLFADDAKDSAASASASSAAAAPASQESASAPSESAPPPDTEEDESYQESEAGGAYF